MLRTKGSNSDSYFRQSSYRKGQLGDAFHRMVKRLLSPKTKNGFKCLNSWDDISSCLKAALRNTRLSYILCTRNTQNFRETVLENFREARKNSPLVPREQVFYRNSSALANFCQSFPSETHQFPGSLLDALRQKWPLEANCWGQPMHTDLPRIKTSVPAATQLAGHAITQVLRGGPGGQGAGYSALIMKTLKKDNSYDSRSNISKCSTFQWNGNFHVNWAVPA